MRVDPQQLKTEIEPLVVVHGVELVALEWLLGQGRGVLRIYIDRPGGDPRTPPDERGPGATADICASVSRDVSALLDAQEELIPVSYDLEVSSPGFERPVQKRADFDRFAGLVLKLKPRVPVEGRGSFEGVLKGTTDRPDGGFAVRLEVGGREMEFDARDIARARLAEIKAPRPPKPGKGPRKPRGPSAEGEGHATTTQPDEAGTGADPRDGEK